MAGLESTINIRSSEYRPCIILGKKALFHRWTEKKNIVLECDRMVCSSTLVKVREEFEKTNVIPNGFTAVKYGGTYAIVEFEDGSTALINPRDVRFLDSGNLFYENSMFFREEPEE